MMPSVSTTKTMPEFPALYRTWRQELSPPFRRCRKAVAVRIPFTARALVVGIWRRRLEDEDAAYAAAGFYLTPYLEKDRVGQA